RRGDRFYVKIPAADVPRAETTRGRGFADVKAQRNGESTLVSFRLQPGATAHVEQRGSKLDVVVSVPGGGTPSVASNRTAANANLFESNPKTGGSGATPKTTTSSNANANKKASNSNRNAAVRGNAPAP